MTTTLRQNPCKRFKKKIAFSFCYYYRDTTVEKACYQQQRKENKNSFANFTSLDLKWDYVW